jgi:ABC-type dipeptide/oligopeptide/nickel transport system permease subunit
VLAGLPFVLAAYFTSEFVRILCGVAAAMFIIPGFVYVYVIVIGHWKDRYRGNHSDMWGALILIETSGWMKLVYIFRHVVPDMHHTGRYRLESPPPIS